MILDSIHSPEDIRALDQNQLPQLCKELRQFLLENVSKTGGHFSSNLGVVELTVDEYFAKLPDGASDYEKKSEAQRS